MSSSTIPFEFILTHNTRGTERVKVLSRFDTQFFKRHLSDFKLLGFSYLFRRIKFVTRIILSGRLICPPNFNFKIQNGRSKMADAKIKQMRRVLYFLTSNPNFVVKIK